MQAGSAHLAELWRKDKTFRQPLQGLGTDTSECGIFAKGGTEGKLLSG